MKTKRLRLWLWATAAAVSMTALWAFGKSSHRPIESLDLAAWAIAYFIGQGQGRRATVRLWRNSRTASRRAEAAKAARTKLEHAFIWVTIFAVSGLALRIFG